MTTETLAIRIAVLEGSEGAGSIRKVIDAVSEITVMMFRALRTGFHGTGEKMFYDRWRASAANPLELSLTTGRRGGSESGPIFGLGRLSTVPITGASSIPSA